MYHNMVFASTNQPTNQPTNRPTDRPTDPRTNDNQQTRRAGENVSSQAHVQVMVPHYTETWGALRDAEVTESIPECVIHSFPTSINHTIGWAKELLRDHFCDGESGPAQARCLSHYTAASGVVLFTQSTHKAHTKHTKHTQSTQSTQSTTPTRSNVRTKHHR